MEQFCTRLSYPWRPQATHAFSTLIEIPCQFELFRQGTPSFQLTNGERPILFGMADPASSTQLVSTLRDCWCWFTHRTALGIEVDVLEPLVVLMEP